MGALNVPGFLESSFLLSCDALMSSGEAGAAGATPGIVNGKRERFLKKKN